MPTDRDEFKLDLIRMFILYGKELNTKRLQLYLDELMDTGFRLEMLRDLIGKAIKTCEFLPSIANILKPVMIEIELAKEELKAEKWAEFQMFMFSRSGSPDWVAKMMNQIGYQRIRMATSPEMRFIKKEFLEFANILFKDELDLESQKKFGEGLLSLNQPALPSGG